MKLLCEAMIPVLAVLLIALGCKSTRDRRRPLAVIARLAVALAWVYLLHFSDMHWKVWKGWELDFSTHTGVALALGCTLAGLGRSGAAGTAVLWVAYAFLMIRLGYHSLPDILTTAAAVLPGTIAAQFLLRRRGNVAQ